MSLAYHILIMAVQYKSDDEPKVMLIKGHAFIEDGTKPFPDGSSVWTDSLSKNKQSDMRAARPASPAI